MSIKKLLAAASVAAMMAGSAQALELVDSTLGPALGSDGIILANELDMTVATGTPVPGQYTFDLTLTSGGNFPTGTALLLDVTLPDGVVFSAAVNGSDVSMGVGAAVGAPGTTAGSVNSGGAAGSSTVQFLLATPAATSPSINFNLEVDHRACTTGAQVLTVNATVQGVAASDLEGDTAGGQDTTNALFPLCASGIAGGVTSDAATFDTTVALAPATVYSHLDEDPLPFVVHVPVVDGTFTPLGGMSYALSAANVSLLAAAATADGTPAAAPVADPMVVGDIASVTYNVAFGDTAGNAAGLAGVDLFDGFLEALPALGVAPFTACPGAATGGAFACTITGAGPLGLLLDPTADPIGVTAAAGATQILGQSAAVSGALVNFADSAGRDFIANETGANGGLDTLQREGQTFGPYDWNNEMGAVNSIYRVTGLPAGDLGYSILYTNSNAGAGFNTTIAGLTIAAADILNGEAILTSRGAISTANPGYTRSDVTFTFETSNTLDVDRLISSKGVVADFGAGNTTGAPAVAGTDDD